MDCPISTHHIRFQNTISPRRYRHLKSTWQTWYAIPLQQPQSRFCDKLLSKRPFNKGVTRKMPPLQQRGNTQDVTSPRTNFYARIFFDNGEGESVKKHKRRAMSMETSRRGLFKATIFTVVCPLRHGLKRTGWETSTQYVGVFVSRVHLAKRPPVSRPL